MAEQALEKLDEQLNCAICLDTYTDPKLLQCFHVYCRKCLVKLVVRDQQGQLSLTCPTCRKVTPIPDNGVSGLQSAFHINHLLELRDSFEKIKVPTFPKERVGGAATGITPEERVILRCSEHTDKELEGYCETCEEVICFKCVLKGGKHQGHDSITLDAALDKYQGEITSSLEPIEKQLTTINSALAQLDTCCEEISNQRAAIEDSIHKTFRHLHEILDVRKTELISELHQMTQGKLKSLATQRDQIETTQAQLSSCLDFMRESLRKGYQAEVLMMKNAIAKQVKEVTATYCQADTLKPNTEADMTFLASSDMSALCQNYGRITLAPADPSNKDMGEVARGSPLTLAVEKLGTPIQMKGPDGVAIHNNREIIVTSHTKDCVSILDQSGKELRSFGTHGSAQGQFDCPSDVAVDGEGNILVADSGNHRIQKFTAGGHFLTAVGTEGSGPLQFKYPRGITFNASNSKIYVVNRSDNRIQILNSDLTYFSTYGRYGSGRREVFNYPPGIACDSTGKVYVADNNNHCIEVFTAEGEFLTMFGRKGQGRGELRCPVGVAVDTSDRVYVCEYWNHCVSVFTSEGQFLTSFGKEGKAPGEFDFPRGLAVDNSGVVYVCDRDRLQYFIVLSLFVHN